MEVGAGQIAHRSRHVLDMAGEEARSHSLAEGEFVFEREPGGGPWRIVSTNADAILPPPATRPRREGTRELVRGAILLGATALAWALFWRIQRPRLAAERLRPAPPLHVRGVFLLLAFGSAAGLALVALGVFRLVRLVD